MFVPGYRPSPPDPSVSWSKPRPADKRDRLKLRLPDGTRVVANLHTGEITVEAPAAPMAPRRRHSATSMPSFRSPTAIGTSQALGDVAPAHVSRQPPPAATPGTAGR